MTMLTWIKCQGDVWCSLEKVNLSTVTTAGVYIIWHGGNPPNVVRVGQGKISDRLAIHRIDPDILAYKQFGELFVTWASVPAAQQDGVERYLADQSTPLVGDVFPDAAPIPVNLPL